MSAAPLTLRHHRVQRLRRLSSRRSARAAERAFVAEGVNLAREALDSGAAIESLYWEPGAPPDLLARAHDAGVRVFELAPGVLERVADAATPQPVVTVVDFVDVPLDALAGVDMIVVCHDLRDPGNAGTVLRAARAAGAGGVVFCDGSVDVYNPKTVRASAGSIFGLPVVAGGRVEEVMETIGSWGVTRLAAVATGGGDYAAGDLVAPFALLVGNEAHGLDPAAVGGVDRLVTIPMAEGVESLNVGVACAVICFEAARQRRSVTP